MQNDITQLVQSVCQNSFRHYIKYMMPDFEFNWHHDHIIDKLEAVERGDIRRLIVTMPPRHSKSFLVSQWFPTWYMGRNPDRQIIQAAYSKELVEGFGRFVRNTIKGEEKYSHVFPGVTISEDSKSVSRFNLKDHKGIYIASGVGGMLTGRGAHLAIVDDPIKNSDDAQSDILREKMWEWYETTLRTRLMPKGAIIVCATRWHSDDLIGRLLFNDVYKRWEVLNFPALDENDKALWPAWYDTPYLLEIKQSSSAHTWSSLYQQDPIVDGGNYIKQAWFRYYTSPPTEFKHTVWSIDTATKTGKQNDYSVAQMWGATDTGYYLLRQIRAKMEYPELRHRLESALIEYPADEVLVEDTSSGQQLVQDFKSFTAFPIIPMVPGKNMPRDKEERLSIAAPQFEAGNVYFPAKTEFVFDLQDELIGFPYKKHDDQVDATTMALYRMTRKKRRNNNVIPMPITVGTSLKYK